MHPDDLKPLMVEDMQNLSKKVYALLKEEIGLDRDMSPRVTFTLVNRERYMGLNFEPILLSSKVLTEDDEDRLERALSFNLAVATDALDIWFKIRDHARYDRKMQKHVVDALVPFVTEYCKKHVKKPTISNFVSHLNRVSLGRFNANDIYDRVKRFDKDCRQEGRVPPVELQADRRTYNAVDAKLVLASSRGAKPVKKRPKRVTIS